MTDACSCAGAGVAEGGGAEAIRSELHIPGTQFGDVLWTLLFVSAVWIAGKLFGKLGTPALVGEIIVGVLLGPQVAILAPQPAALMLYGEVGLLLLVLEAGLDVDIPMLRLIGARTFHFW